ncbi:unnamed protein product [Hermetia illucens]|uniref:Uncharacterized protein n=1 Tax=Hermetia illucens TaxID=343691 RepID=A0A7R8UTF9_HERIL|nr:unnamed protein product [Hermetia illucens]
MIKKTNENLKCFFQESGITTTTGTGTSSSTTSSSGSDSDSSDSDSSDSESGSSTDDESEKPDESTPMSESELEPIYRSCVRNLEECVTRFSEHYKSIYRLVNHYLRAPEKLRDMEMCKNLLLGSYVTKLGNQIMGLFADRKNNNFFNGIWRIPSSEIDRPGSFSAHLVKCVVILLEVLKKSKDHKVLIDMAVQLNRPPDNDKRYIKEIDRKELCEQSLSFCVQVMRDCLKQCMEKRNDDELLNLILDIFKTQKVCNKHISQKESLFEQILVDAYKFYIQDKVTKMPDNANLVDLAVKLCNQEISVRKNQEKQALAAAAAANQPASMVQNLMDTTITAVCMPSTTIPMTTATVSKPVTIPGITSRPRGRPVGSKTVNKNIPPPAIPPSLFDPATIAALLYSNPGFNNALSKDPNYMKTLTQEYYKILLGSPSISSLLSSNLPKSTLSSTFPSSSAPPQPSTSSMTSTKPQIPQFDMNTLMASLASQTGKSAPTTQSSSSTINLGSGELTITPTTSKPTIPGTTKEPKHSSSASLASQIFSSSMAGTSISMTRVPTPMPVTGSKSDTSNLSSSSVSQLPLLPDLPKSLTITPAPSFSSEKLTKTPTSSPQMSQLSMFPDKSKEPSKYPSKSKASKKTNVNPYARPPSAPLSTSPSSFPGASAAQLNSLSALAQQMPFMGNFNLQNYNSQVNLLKTYADLFTSMGIPPAASMGPAGLGQIPPFQMPVPPKRSTTKKPRAPKSQPRFTSPSQATSSTVPTPRLPDSITAIPIPPTKTKQSPQSFVPSPFNVPLSKSPILAHSSPNPSPGLSPGLGSVGVLGAAHQSTSTVTPPTLPTPPGAGTTLIQSSPTKTLQQKLAERQKANALNESSSAHRPGSGGSGSGSGGGQQASKKKEVDVIILD